MLLDVLAGLDELKICTAYTIDGQTSTNFPADARVLERVEPVYETLPGFAADVTQCTEFDALPAEAHGYLKFIEDFIGVPVTMVSVGPKRSQSIFR